MKSHHAWTVAKRGQGGPHDTSSTTSSTKPLAQLASPSQPVLQGPYSIDRLHQRLNQGSPGLNIDALLSPRDDVRLGGSPHRGPPVSLSGHRDPAPLASPPLCRSNSALPLPTTTGHGAGPSLINTSPMCMQSALSDLFNPDSVKRSRLEEVEAFMTGGKRARPEDMHDEHVPNPAAAAAAVEPDRVPPSDLRRVGRVPQSELNLKLTPAIDAVRRPAAPHARPLSIAWLR